MDCLPRLAEYGRPRSDPRQGWWVSAESAMLGLQASSSTTRYAGAVGPSGANVDGSGERVGSLQWGADCSAESPMAISSQACCRQCKLKCPERASKSGKIVNLFLHGRQIPRRCHAAAVIAIPRPGISLDSALGTFDMENVLKERMHVQREETRCRGVRGSP